MTPSLTGHLRRSRVLTGLLLVLFGGCIPELPIVDDPCAPWEETGLFRITMDPEDSKNRRPYVWIPPGKGPRHLVVALHGGTSSARDFGEVTQHIRLADREGFVAIFPDGLGTFFHFWNAGSCCGTADEEARDREDVAFLDDLVDVVSERTCGDRVLATGFSNGGMMVHRWACEGKRVDGAVPSSGPLMSRPEKCTGAPIPIRHYHGVQDPIVPVEGGVGEGAGGNDYRSVEDTISVWRERNGCTSADPVFTVEGDTSCTAWQCEVPTELCLIAGWGHAWPGGRNSGNTDANATVDGWDWFDTQAIGDQGAGTETNSE